MPKGVYTRQPLVVRFWSKVDRPEVGCWEWRGAKQLAGYGLIKPGDGGSWLLAHRVSYEFAYGALPDGMFACHRCDNPSCVRPSHLFAGTHQDNMRDMTVKRRHWRHAATTCPNGHAYTPANTVTVRGARACVRCRRARAVRWSRSHA